MKTTHRGYSEESGDFARLCRLMVATRGDSWQSTTWCLGRMVDWKYGLWEHKLDSPRFWERNAHLWLDAFGDLVGLVISENGDASFAAITPAVHRFLYAELLDWTLEHWGGRGPQLSTEVAEGQDLEVRALEARGFRRGAPFMTRRFDLAQVPVEPFPLEPGFKVVDMRSHPDYRARRLLRASTFVGREVVSGEEMRQKLRLDTYALGSPIYRPECDMAVLAPDGRLVAGCEALLDAKNGEADIERVCTHSAFRHRGFARALLAACMVRLREMGLRHAYLTGYSDVAIGLYGSLGPAEELRCWIYERAR